MKGNLRNKWRHIPWAARWAISVSAVIITFYSVENFRGWYALKIYREYWESKGEWFDLADKPVVEGKPGESNLIDYLAVKTLIDDPDSLSIKRIDEALAQELIRAGRKKWRNSHLFPFGELLSLDPHQSRRNAAELFLKKIADRSESLDLLAAAINDADVFKVDRPDSLMDQQMEYTSLFLKASGTLKLRAAAGIACNDSDGACRDVCALLKLGSFLVHDDATMLDLLVSYTLQQTALTPLWEGLQQNSWTEPHLAQFASHIPLNPEKGILHAMFQLERLHTLEAMRTMDSFTERINKPELFSIYLSHGVITFPDIPDSIPLGDTIEELIPLLLFIMIPDGWYDLWTIQICEEMRQSLQPEGGSGYLPALAEIWQSPLNTSFGYVSVYNRSTEEKVTMTLAAVAVASGRYYIANQKYPDSLMELIPQYLPETPVDLYSGKPLIYIPPGVRSDGPVIYSIGENGKDDNGYPCKKRNRGDLVWQYELPKGFSIGDYEKSTVPVLSAK
ncbi:MAG: hypothetical protein P1V20_05840 [Verrucomicrobiales bacterium]|nr:hypothetical protein [Verrucomicrobiales bacterium]